MSIRDLAKSGDLLFYRVAPNSGPLAKIIGMVQLWRGEGRGAQYSHVAIVDLDAKHLIEAYWPLIRRRSIDWTAPGIELWRVKQAQPAYLNFSIGWARAKVGLPYDFGHALFGFFNFKHAEKCTSLINGAWRALGQDLSPRAGRFLGPSEFVESPYIGRIG